MCMLCVEIQKGLMTSKEVARAYREFTVENTHLAELMKNIDEKYGLDNIANELNKLVDE